MTKTTRNAGMLALLAALVPAFAGCDRPAPAAAQEEPTTRAAEPTREELLARIEALETLLPSQSHMMADVGYHFSNLWFAGRAENWPLAEFYLAETRSHLRWAVRRIPIRKDNRGQDINLVNILEAFENGSLDKIQESIAGQDRATFEALYRESLTMCYSCHKASDKPYLRPQIPDEPDTRVINFDPDADWPL
jgi:hypothetical protein